MFVWIETKEDTEESKGLILVLQNIVKHRKEGNKPEDYQKEYNSLLDDVESLFKKTGDINDISEAKAIEARATITASKKG